MIAIGLFVAGKKGVNCLNAVSDLCNTKPNFFLNYVVAARDKNVVNDYFEEIKALCDHNNYLFFERTSELKITAEADVIFAISWRWIIQQNIEKLIVFHDSILPQLRGFNPLVTSLIEGYNEIGVTAIKANKEFDKGNILGTCKTKISYPIKIEKATEIVSELYAELIVSILLKKANNSLHEIAQDENQASYSLWRDETDYEIDWNQSADRIVRTIDALGFPYKGASIKFDGRTVRIKEAVLVDELEIINRTPGKLLFLDNQNPVVVCGKGLLKITEAIYEDDGTKVNFNKLRIRL
ncbi:methionyl-tRNA formyltransferase [Flavobacterium sp. 25HG05S-40]|uniref:methionyl-tRNA formyltransferase n=1 Tax=Flavobacterium sp. 25HG05S-40 TaxID=3458682 RepID=UPI004044E653